MKRIKLTNYDSPALIDDTDYALIKPYRWYWDHGYVRSSSFQKKTYMHRLIMDAPRREQVDHKNRNGLDNRRSNLRLCSDMQNKHNMAPYKNNKSGLKGVTFFQGKYWRATIVVNKKQISLGLYKTPGEAARAYDEAALANFGEFARINGTRN